LADGTAAPAINKRSETIRRIVTALGDRLDDSGSVLTNGWRTLEPGLLYVMGLNPGGETQRHREFTLRRHLDELGDDTAALQFGDNGRFATNVRAMVCAFHADADRVFMTNAIFLRTAGALDLNGREHQLFEASWPVHAWFLSIVRPKIILCLGNGRSGPSAMGLLAGKAGIDWDKDVRYAVNAPSRNRFRHGCWFDAVFPVSGDGQQGLSCTVVGAPHPSRFGATDDFRAFAQRLANRVGATS
jgi:hypothetical protein